MKSHLTFDFTVNKETNAVFVNREFAADRNVVWDAYTKAELLDQWWAPKPWVSKTKSMNFAVGGRRLYAMCGPEGEAHWAIQDFTSISPMTNFKFIDAFCDKDETFNTEMPRSAWSIDFEDRKDTTLVSITIQHKTLADLEMIINLGFKEGFTIALDGLDELVSTMKK
jgi:uncharacterized protein YndB with AHSA1/START domain